MQGAEHLRVVHEVLEIPRHDHCDLYKLVDKVVGEVDVVSDTARHTRDVGEEAVHAVLVSATSVNQGKGTQLKHQQYHQTPCASRVLVGGTLHKWLRRINGLRGIWPYA